VSGPQRVSLLTADRVRLSALHWDAGVRTVGCVVAHGFTGSAAKPHVQAICAALRERGFGVLAPDLRGHGRSAGKCTAGADERYDIAAAVDWLRGQNYERIVVLGWSMGGSAVLRYAGLGGAADAVVTVSSPGVWFERGTRAMRIVHWMCETRSGRLATRLARRTRIASVGWTDVPEAPAEVVGSIAPTPLLIVHGDNDHYFPTMHVETLALAAPSAEVWIEPGMGHAETATTPELVARIASWVAAAVPAPAVAARDVCDDDARD
jgi:pimeloyl-ACP methyl ester carboxylesterase